MAMAPLAAPAAVAHCTVAWCLAAPASAAWPRHPAAKRRDVPGGAIKPAATRTLQTVAELRPSVQQGKHPDSTDDKRGLSPAEARDSSLLSWRTTAASVLAAAVVAAGTAQAAHATDSLKICKCLFQNCRVELAKCVADPKCAANLTCLQTCNNRPDETECQIGCGDLFENAVVDEFNKCAVSDKGCVPQKPDTGQYPVPAPQALVQKFDPHQFDGSWYISSGLNQTFDTFDCQFHQFTPIPGGFQAKLQWRISTPDGGFFTRTADQRFLQDEKQPGILYNHGNAFLHYQDDWYILGAKTEGNLDDYILVYYKGKNDAWDGYGGAVLYTRTRSVPQSIVPEVTEACRKAGLDYAMFTPTDNTCPPELPLVERVEQKVEKEVEKDEKVVVNLFVSLKNGVAEVGRKGLMAVQNLVRNEEEELKKDEERLLQELGEEERQILKDLRMGVRDIEALFSKPLSVRKLR